MPREANRFHELMLTIAIEWLTTVRLDHTLQKELIQVGVSGNKLWPNN
jgi:hypothetical protein